MATDGVTDVTDDLIVGRLDQTSASALTSVGVTDVTDDLIVGRLDRTSALIRSNIRCQSRLSPHFAPQNRN